MKTQRDPSVELFRCLMMFGVCLIHTFGLWCQRESHVANALYFCVPGFAFVSGYFGTRFRLMKTIRLYALAFYCILLALMIATCWHGDNFAFFQIVWRALLVLCRSCWFLHAYVVMTIFAPFVNKIVDEENVSQILACCIPLLAFCWWSWLNCVPYVWRFPFPMDASMGGGGYSGVALLGAYVVGRLYRRFDFDNKLNAVVASCCAVLCLGVTTFCMPRYDSPISIAEVVFLFYLIRRIPLNSWFSKCVLSVTPSLFAIYLLHSNSPLKGMIIALESKMPILGIMSGIIVFAGCLCLDLLRRIILSITRHVVRAFYSDAIR